MASIRNSRRIVPEQFIERNRDGFNAGKAWLAGFDEGQRWTTPTDLPVHAETNGMAQLADEILDSALSYYTSPDNDGETFTCCNVCDTWEDHTDWCWVTRLDQWLRNLPAPVAHEEKLKAKCQSWGPNQDAASMGWRNTPHQVQRDAPPSRGTGCVLSDFKRNMEVEYWLGSGNPRWLPCTVFSVGASRVVVEPHGHTRLRNVLPRNLRPATRKDRV